ncbi:MAG TPA: hypothetical protein VLH81_04005 [Desulfobacterales bacterium]|nr:hypothetical protein [Desulfobacterales bacterium]
MSSQRTIARRILTAAVLGLLLAGCAAVPQPARSPHLGAADPLGRCAVLFASLDERALRADALDGGSFRVEGHPYLRVDRFLASFRGEALEGRSFDAWVDRMQALDLGARRNELANSAAAGAAADADAALLREAAACGDRMKAVDFASAERRAAFRERLNAPSEYIPTRRVLGIYPVVSLFVSAGVSDWHAEARREFSNEPPPDPPRVRYAPTEGADPAAAARIVATAARDALGVPVYDEAALEALFRRHAPVWLVRTATDDDRIGTPFWGRDGEIGVDAARPTVYTRPSFTRFGADVLTQLNFVVWFPARPRTNALDIYGGRLDGINFRVTLDVDGAPLLYEKIHNCGCYYTAYPLGRLRPQAVSGCAEKPLILPPPVLDGARPALALESGTHYVNRFFAENVAGPATAVPLAFAPYERLLSLPTPEGGRRSMFAPDGIAPGTDRLERFILWPTGVASPGAMRQWGRHAVAFVGERHFDDPFALDRLFVRVGAP